MKKLLLIPAFIICIMLGGQSLAQGSGYSMAVLMDDVVVLAKFDSSFFSRAEADNLSQMVAGLLTSYAQDAHVFLHHQLGDPDAWRSALKHPAYQDLWEIFFLDITKAANPAGAQNIRIDIWYENESMYIATLGVPEEFLEMIR